MYSNTLYNKVVSKELKRKQSETVNKFVAGLFDADGCIYFRLKKYKDYYTLNLKCEISQSFSVDPDGEMLHALARFYGFGKFDYKFPERGTTVCRWAMGTRDTLKLMDHLIKHMCIKAKHAKTLIQVYKTLKGLHFDREQAEILRQLSKKSRLDVGPIHPKKHPAWAWLAGYLAGDGCFFYRERKRYSKRIGKYTTQYELRVESLASYDDQSILHFIHKALKGNINSKPEGIHWCRALGAQNSKFAVKFLRKMKNYMLLRKKLDKIQKMIEFHDNRVQRLNEKAANNS